MANRFEYPGYAITPGCKKTDVMIRLEFNPTIAVGPKDARLERFNLRMYWLPDSFGQEDAEIAVTMSAEQWLDLIEEMKRMYDKTEGDRKDFDNLFTDNE